MEAKDLMIGDYYWWEAEGKKYPLQVTKDTFRLYDEDIANFEPIPITEELLERNGFVDCHTIGEKFERRKRLNNREYQLISYYFAVNELSIKTEYSYSLCPTIYKLRIKYIHELQHALRLVGFSEIADNLKV